MKTMNGKKSSNIKCYSCGKSGHKAIDCWSKDKKTSRNNRWCAACKSNTHDTKYCRKKSKPDTANQADCDGSQGHSFFKVDHVMQTELQENCLLVDTGATAHIITDESKFVSFDKNFNPEKHFIELANGQKSNVALKRGVAKVSLIDEDGKPRSAMLSDALYVPSFPQDIFSVQSATRNGATVTFGPDSATLVSKDGTSHGIIKIGKLYYLGVVETQTDSVCATRSLQEWHEILGHCNVSDVLKLENAVDGMKITGKRNFECGICIEGKLSQSRNRSPDERANKPLELVHCDLSGPIEPVAKDGFKYVLSFVDDFSGLIMIYFLRTKDDTLRATERYLADIRSYGCDKCKGKGSERCVGSCVKRLRSEWHRIYKQGICGTVG